MAQTFSLRGSLNAIIRQKHRQKSVLLQARIEDEVLTNRASVH